MKRLSKCAYVAWLGAIVVLAALHALHLSADFPNGSPWHADWAKYTDEGWYANAAVRAHLFGNWYQTGDFNPAAALPLWPALEWVAFAVAGVSLKVAREVAVLCFFANLALSYLLVRARAPRWAALMAVTLIAASPFLYSFSRLAILEPALTTLTLAAMNVAVRAGKSLRPRYAAIAVGLLFALMMLTKLTAVFLAPALAWAVIASWMASPHCEGFEARRQVWTCTALALGAAGAAYGAWMALIAHFGLLRDYRYLLLVNRYPKPPGLTWPLASFWWSLHGALWVDGALIPLAGLAFVSALVAGRGGRARLVGDPVFGAAFWAVAGCILFMTYQDHPQPRYFAVVAYFCFILIALCAAALVESQGRWMRRAGGAVIAVAVLAAGTNAARTIDYVLHPQYTFVNAAQALTRYIDAHPNGRRMLVSVSGDQIMLATHLPALCDDFGTVDLPEKLGMYQPGWFASWNDLDPGTLQDLHTRYSIEQVASFPAFDDRERNVLVLFKLHPLPNGAVREIDGGEDLKQPLPDDKIDLMIE